MAYQSFEELEVWQRGCRLVVSIFEAFADCKCISLKNQIERAGLSVPSNIAEGAERVRSFKFPRSPRDRAPQLYIAGKLNVLDPSLVRQLVKESKEVSSMLEGLRKAITRSARSKSALNLQT
jgi:four helix bundle protein